ncbi:N-(5'-phosphoribosyl)anthranilate isomerase [invertebrate metagenome]|uniref:phosphoribosylanthranilate isomerase n=1 Tax=invertebrate metagenome TaxID=1711999 RepID=A0A2H9T9H4_9ZZZZ
MIQKKPKIKICGITSLDDALMAAGYGADALGFIFSPSSPRYIEPLKAAEIIRCLPSFVMSVGVFVDADAIFISHVLGTVMLDRLQFHGKESESFCSRWHVPYIKALRIKQETVFDSYVAAYPSASAFLFDTYQKKMPGGTGKTFDWQQVPKNFTPLWILAGGLGPGNIESALKQVYPYAIDVNSGVEKKPGIKDENKVKALFEAVFGMAGDDN